MALASCLLHFAAMVVSFNGQSSFVNITSPALSGEVSSMVIQFKTTQANSQIGAMMSGSRSFAVIIQNGKLQLKYDFNLIGNGTFDLGVVNTNKWFVLNITKRERSTVIQLSETDNSLRTSCEPSSTTKNITLFGKEFSNLLKTSGLRIGGRTDDKSLKSFQGCVGLVSLNNHVIDLLNKTKDSQPFKREIVDTSTGCQCGKDPCVNGVYWWDKTKGHCECKCKLGYHGEFCQNQTLKEVSDDDDADSEHIYIVVGVAVGVLLLVTLAVCVVVYIKRTSSSVFGVYNPKNQEQVQGQNMNAAFTLPVPEKLI